MFFIPKYDWLPKLERIFHLKITSRVFGVLYNHGKKSTKLTSLGVCFQILPGNTNTYAVANNSLSPPIFASKIRLLPHSDHQRTVCLRVELVGCRFLGKNPKSSGHAFSLNPGLFWYTLGIRIELGAVILRLSHP